MAHGTRTRAISGELISGSMSDPVTSSEQVWDYSQTDSQNKPRTQEAINAEALGKQDRLVSGTNIKTINNNSLLGSGNITITTSGAGTLNTTTSNTLSVQSSESLGSSVSLHRVSKTGKYTDLVFGGTGMNQKVIKSGTALSTQMNQEDTIYIIQDDVNISNYTVTVPSGCVLKFEGGKIYSSISGGGTLVGQNTKIDAGLEQIFDGNVAISGTWNVTDIYSMWFPNGTNCLVKAFALTNPGITNNVYIADDTYTLEITEDLAGAAAITVNSNVNVYLDGTINLTPYYKYNGCRYGYYMFYLDGDNINITGSGSIIGDRLTTDPKMSRLPQLTTEPEYGHGIVIKGDNIKIENITIKECYGDCVDINGKRRIDNTPTNIPIRYTLNHLTLTGYRRNGVSVTQAGDGEITNCYIGNGGDTSPRAAVDVEPNDGDTIGNTIISNCTISNTRTGLQLLVRATVENTNAYANSFAESMVIENCSLQYNTKAFTFSGNDKCNTVKIKNTTADHAVASDTPSVTEYFLSISKVNKFELSNSTISKEVADSNNYAFYFNIPGSCTIESSELYYAGSFIANTLSSMLITNSSLNCRSLCGTLTDTIIEGCKINGSIYPTNFRYCSIRDNIFRIHDKTEDNFNAAGFTLYLGVRANSDSHSNIIESNTFDMNFSNSGLTLSANAIVIQGADNTVISNVIIDNSENSGIRNAGILLQSTSENNNVWGNIFENFGTKRKIVDYSTDNKNAVKSVISNSGTVYPTLQDKYYDNGNCGHMFFDANENKPMWWTGNRWKDAIDTIKLPVPDTECIQYLDGNDSDSGGEYKTVTIASNPNLTVKCYSTGTNAGQFIVNGTCVESGGRSTKLSKTFVLPAGTYNLTYTLISGSRGNIGKEMAICLNKTSDNSLISGFGSTPTEVILAEDTSCYVGFNFHAGESYNVNVVPSIKNAGLFSLTNVIEDILERLDQLEGN